MDISWDEWCEIDVLDRSKDIYSCFQCKQMSTYVDNLIKRYRALRVRVENVFEKIDSLESLFFSSGRVEDVCSIKTNSK